MSTVLDGHTSLRSNKRVSVVRPLTEIPSRRPEQEQNICDEACVFSIFGVVNNDIGQSGGVHLAAPSTRPEHAS